MNTSASKYHIEALFKHSIDVDRELSRITLFIQLLFRNLSRDSVDQPKVILHIQPKQAVLSGKIISPELIRTLGVYTRQGNQTGWVYTSHDWYKEARSTGEYHIAPIEAITLTPGVWIEMKDWQVEFDWEKATEPLHINGWIELEGYRHPVLNPIFIHFSA